MTLPLIVMLYRKNKRLQASYLTLYEQQQKLIRQADADRLAREQAAAQAAQAAQAVQDAQDPTPETNSQPATKARPLNIDPDELDKAKVRILDVLDHSDDIYNPDFSLDRLAELTGIKSRQLSSIINEAFDKNFYALLNEFRIREACRRLVDTDRYGNLTIEAISVGAGYRSRTSLVNAFKKETGLTPSEYQRTSRQRASI